MCEDPIRLCHSYVITQLINNLHNYVYKFGITNNGVTSNGTHDMFLTMANQYFEWLTKYHISWPLYPSNIK